MRIRNGEVRCLFAVATVLFTLAAGSARAAEMLPTDVVLELLEVAPRWGSDNPSLIIGAPPAGLEDEVVMPEGIDVLVSVSRGESVSIIGRSGLSKAQAIAGFEASLAETGWALYTPEVKATGFQPSEEDRGKTFCREQGGSVWVDVKNLSSEESAVHLTLHRGEYGRGCSSLDRMSRMMDIEPDIPFPTLYPPEEAKSQGGGGSSSSGNSLERSTYVEVEMSAGELLVHYASQLSAAGWQPDAAVEYKSVGYQSWILLDEAGKEWHGLMLVIPTLRGENKHEVSMRVSRIADD